MSARRMRLLCRLTCTVRTAHADGDVKTYILGAETVQIFPLDDEHLFQRSKAASFIDDLLCRGQDDAQRAA